MKRGDTFETNIVSLAFGGRGIGHSPDGRVAFVDDTVPGDTVLAYYTKIKRDYVEARVESVLSPSEDRVEPRCRHVGECGGCRLQHMRYEAQAAAKGLQVAEALAHLGGLAEVPVRDTVPAASPWAYRNKMDFTFGTTDEGRVALGMHRRGRFDRIVDLSECHLVDERVMALVAAVREWATTHGLDPYEPRGAVGLLRYLVVRLGQATGDVLVDLVTTSPAPPESASFVGTVRSVFENATVVHTTHRGRATAYMVETQEVLIGRGSIEERLGEWRFEISPESFFQTNTAMAELLCSTAADAAGLTGDERVLDLYCGTGAIGITLSRQAGSVLGLEVSEAAVANAVRNAALNEVDNATFVAAKAEEGLAEVLQRHGPFDVAVVDPPRAGLHPKALRTLADCQVGRIAYVSCNPATLARDLATLGEAGFRVLWVQPIDMFPHTPHVEAVVALQRA